ncbi:hypothetical protein SAMN05660489_05826 [Pseudomonas sp. LAMO17WK12:I10]|nr:hypothetical protein SAMN05660489_05826 [Pseudomonas sp. LAMO17WK12:I10]
MLIYLRTVGAIGHSLTALPFHLEKPIFQF